jgi:hypothetical protein
MIPFRLLDDLHLLAGVAAILDTAYDRHCQRRMQRERDQRDQRLADLEKRLAELEARQGEPTSGRRG